MNSPSPTIRVDALSFTYPKQPEPAVRDLSFQIEAREIFGFLGPSGAGKSTTQKILIGLLTGFEGTVQVMGKDLTAWGKDLYEDVGVSFELPSHFLKLTAKENLSYFRSLYKGDRREVEEILELVGLAGEGDKQVGQYSKGMKNRLNFGRSILHRPSLLFLDEPTAGLDPVNAGRIKNLIETLRSEGATIFMTTHDKHIADELCDRVAFIVDGEISLIDSPRSLKLEHGKRCIRVEYTEGDVVNGQEFEMDGLAENEAFHHILRAHHVETIHSQETSLEDIFIQVTGRTLS